MQRNNTNTVPNWIFKIYYLENTDLHIFTWLYHSDSDFQQKDYLNQIS